MLIRSKYREKFVCVEMKTLHFDVHYYGKDHLSESKIRLHESERLSSRMLGAGGKISQQVCMMRCNSSV